MKADTKGITSNFERFCSSLNQKRGKTLNFCNVSGISAFYLPCFYNNEVQAGYTGAVQSELILSYEFFFKPSVKLFLFFVLSQDINSDFICIF